MSRRLAAQRSAERRLLEQAERGSVVDSTTVMPWESPEEHAKPTSKSVVISELAKSGPQTSTERQRRDQMFQNLAVEWPQIGDQAAQAEVGIAIGSV